MCMALGKNASFNSAVWTVSLAKGIFSQPLYLAAVCNLHISCRHSINQLLAIRPTLCFWLGAQDFSTFWAAFTSAFFKFPLLLGVYLPRGFYQSLCVISSQSGLSTGQHYSRGSQAGHCLFSLTNLCSESNVSIFSSCSPTGTIILVPISLG